MAALVPYPKASPAYALGGDRYSGQSVLEFIDTFRTDKNTFISNNDKLHKWTMWRTQVNGSFIRNLPVAQDLPVDEDALREKRIDIDRFMIHSDTDELKRLQMKDVYGKSEGYDSRLGHATYFLYGIPRIATGKPVNHHKGPRVFAEDESIRSRTPTPPPPRKQHLFVGSSQGPNSVLSDDHGMTLELSHAHLSTSVYAKRAQDTLSEKNMYQNAVPQLEKPQYVTPQSEITTHQTYRYEKPQFELSKYEKPKFKPPKPTYQYEAPRYELSKYEKPKFKPPKSTYQYEAPRYELSQYVAPRCEMPKYETYRYVGPRYEIWKEMYLIRDTRYDLEYQEGCVDFEDDLSNVSGYFSS